jgi:hypothetical protein
VDALGSLVAFVVVVPWASTLGGQVEAPGGLVGLVKSGPESCTPSCNGWGSYARLVKLTLFGAAPYQSSPPRGVVLSMQGRARMAPAPRSHVLRDGHPTSPSGVSRECLSLLGLPYLMEPNPPCLSLGVQMRERSS